MHSTSEFEQRPDTFSTCLVEANPDIEVTPPFCPKCMPRTAQAAVTLYWENMPGASSSGTYYVSTNRARTHWILWMEDDPCSYRGTPPSYPVAWCASRGVRRAEAGRALLRTWWHEEVRRYDAGRPSDFSGGPALPLSDVQDIFDDVWPEDTEN